MSTQKQIPKYHSNENFEYLRANDGLSPLADFEYESIEIKNRIVGVSTEKAGLLENVGDALFEFFLWIFQKRYAQRIENELVDLQLRKSGHD